MIRIVVSFLCIFGICNTAFIPPIYAQSGTKTDSLAIKLKNIENRLMQIEKEEKENDVQALLEKAKKMSQKKDKGIDEQKKFHSGLRQQSAMNPNISVGGEFYFATGKSKTDLNRLPSETEWGTGKLFLREIELGVESALDPYSRGKVFIGLGHEEASVEEAYLIWLNCPLNMNLKMGKFKAQFGQLNRYHDHALPQFDRPRALVQFFGNETLHGVGLSGNFLLPRLWAHVNEFDLEVISGGSGFSFTDKGRHQLLYITHFKNYYDLNRSTYIEIGLSGAAGKNDSTEQHSTWIGGADLTLKWQPPGRAKYSGWEWRTECMISRRQEGSDWITAYGGYSSLQVRTGARTLISGRLDFTRLPWDKDCWERGGALALDYWQSEFVFIRLQYTLIDRNFNENDQRLILHTCWAMGPHKHEAY